MLLDLLTNTLQVLLELAPWFLLGLVFAGLVRWLLPDQRLAKLLGTGGVNTVARATVLGAPLPLCSCGVLPTAIGLHRQGLSKPGTVSFLVATPQNGVDSLAVTYALLGPVFTAVRLVTSLISAFSAGIATLLIDKDQSEQRVARSSKARPCASNPTATAGNCATTNDLPQDPTAIPLNLATQPQATTCCSTRPSTGATTHGSSVRNAPPSTKDCCSANPPRTTFLAGQHYAFTKLFNDLAPWLALGVAAAGLMNTVFSPGDIAAWGSGLLPMLAVVAVSIPLYVCASASTPIAASLIAAGASPGVALAFLLVGPATNFAGVALIKRELGLRATAAYLVSLTVTTLALATLVDALAPALNLTDSITTSAGAHLLPPWLALASAAILIALTLKLAITDLRTATSKPQHTTPDTPTTTANA